MDETIRGPMVPSAGPAVEPDQVLLRVKSASHPSCEDLEFPAQSTFSVRQIKEAIKHLSAHHPEIKEQRLIYSGHLLDDNQLLKDVLNANSGSQFNPPNEVVTIHLACTSKSLFTSDNHTAASTGGRKPGNSSNGNADIPQQPMFGNQGFPAAANFNIPQDGGIPQDVMTLHQAYVQQMAAYMNHWYMYQGAMGMGGMYYPFPQPQVPNYVPPQAGPVNAAENIQAPFRPAADNLVAARGAADDDENQRDLLDWMYTLCRVFLVFVVVYFYSSFFRFLLVIVFSGLVVILQRRNVLGNRNGAEAPQQEAHQPQQDENQHEQDGVADQDQHQNADGGQDGEAPPEGVDEVQNIERNQEQEPNGTNAADQPEAAQPANVNDIIAPANANELPPVNLRDVALTFLTTFFTSLIPENYHNNNN